MGPKSENVEKVLVLPLLFEGSRGPRGRQSREQISEPGGFEVQKMRFLIKNALCLYLKMCFLLQRGAHFHKTIKTKWLKSEK